MKLLVAYLIIVFILGPTVVYAQPKSAEVTTGDTAKSMLVLPPWTMRKCPTEFFATYDKDGAKLLKLKDNDCHLWNTQQVELTKQVTTKNSTITTLKAVNEEHEKEHKLDDQRIQDLVKQVKEEIAQKNEYKYKPNYNWLYISIGAAVAIAGIAFGAGVWVAKDNK